MLPGRWCLIFTDSSTSPCTSSLCGIFHGGSVLMSLLLMLMIWLLLLLYYWTLHSACSVSCTILRGLDLVVVSVVVNKLRMMMPLCIFLLAFNIYWSEHCILNKCYEKKTIMMWSVMLLLLLMLLSYSLNSQSTCFVRSLKCFCGRAKKILVCK